LFRHAADADIEKVAESINACVAVSEWFAEISGKIERFKEETRLVL
jgi:hypothetical protein